MFEITAEAAKQIRNAAAQTDSEKMGLRIAAKRGPDGSIQYGMGFDIERENDIELLAEGIPLLISHVSKDLLNGTVLDFVELNPGEFQFIFINPNDTETTPPADDHPCCGGGGCGSKDGGGD
ncbi:MAG: HesB/IscA family protein [Burkholderiales bacterium]